MLEWLRRKIKRWLAADEPPARTIEILIDGEIKKCVAVGVVGISLVVSVPRKNGGAEQIVFDSMAVDPPHFWRLWEFMGGEAMWEDGSRFRPPV